MRNKIVLNIVYYLYLALTAGLIVLMRQLVVTRGYGLDAMSEQGVALSSAVILYVLISIPLSLWGFHKLLSTAKQTMDGDALLGRHTTLSILRMTLIILGGWACVVLFFLMTYKPMMWCGAMTLVAFCFCKPTEIRLRSELADENQQ